MRPIIPSARYYAEKAARVSREAGAVSVVALACRKLASPWITWGSITFFERRLDRWMDSDAASSSPEFHALPLSATNVDVLREGGDPTQQVAELADRLTRGDRAFGAVDATGRVCHVRWVATTRAHIPEIDHDVVLAPGQAYFYNGYTRPDVRRRGIDGLVRKFIFATLQSEGFRRVYSYVRHDNRAGRRAASRWQQAIGTVRYVKVGRSTPWLARISGEIPRLKRPTWCPLRQRTSEDAEVAVIRAVGSR